MASIKYFLFSLLLVLGVSACFSPAFASPVDDVETLISAGVVGKGKEAQAREIARTLWWRELEQQETPLTFSASQDIRFAERTYREREDIRGLLLLAENKSTSSVSYLFRTKCPVVYRIFDAKDTLRYTNETKNTCVTSEIGRATIRPKSALAFPVVHKNSIARLPVGTYRMELSLPHYGSDSLSFTVTRR
jgi:hypothetical protein